MAILELTNANFEQEVLQSELPVLVDFWATWCGPCKMFGPIVEEFAQDNEGKVKVGKVNVDEEPELARKYGIMSIPTAIFFKNGEIDEQMVGVQTLDTLEDLL